MRKSGNQYIMLLGLFVSLAAQALPLPVGYWKTIDDVTGQPRSILQISQQEDNTLSARVVRIFPRPGHSIHELCHECSGTRHNQPVLGMQVLEGLAQSHDEANHWVKGTILDPLNGKTYHCNLTVLGNGSELMVRGYIGMPLFGRSQTWIRVNDANG